MSPARSASSLQHRSHFKLPKSRLPNLSFTYMGMADDLPRISSHVQRMSPRFAVGDHVKINDTIFSRYIGMEGVIMAIRPSRAAKPTNTTLDKYVIAFDNAAQAEFFDIQLVKVS